ncbi:MAG: hypothetical protein M3O22_01200 [Pseudomonadota bacterium]|nr:hypothetical protein [Pseudomonadota bacterium]
MVDMQYGRFSDLSREDREKARTAYEAGVQVFRELGRRRGLEWTGDMEHAARRESHERVQKELDNRAARERVRRADEYIAGERLKAEKVEEAASKAKAEREKKRWEKTPWRKPQEDVVVEPAPSAQKQDPEPAKPAGEKTPEPDELVDMLNNNKGTRAEQDEAIKDFWRGVITRTDAKREKEELEADKKLWPSGKTPSIYSRDPAPLMLPSGLEDAVKAAAGAPKPEPEPRVTEEPRLAAAETPRAKQGPRIIDANEAWEYSKREAQKKSPGDEPVDETTVDAQVTPEEEERTRKRREAQSAEVRRPMGKVERRHGEVNPETGARWKEDQGWNERGSWDDYEAEGKYNAHETRKRTPRPAAEAARGWDGVGQGHASSRPANDQQADPGARDYAHLQRTLTTALTESMRASMGEENARKYLGKVKFENTLVGVFITLPGRPATKNDPGTQPTQLHCTENGIQFSGRLDDPQHVKAVVDMQASILQPGHAVKITSQTQATGDALWLEFMKNPKTPVHPEGPHKPSIEVQRAYAAWVAEDPGRARKVQDAHNEVLNPGKKKPAAGAQNAPDTTATTTQAPVPYVQQYKDPVTGRILDYHALQSAIVFDLKNAFRPDYGAEYVTTPNGISVTLPGTPSVSVTYRDGQAFVKGNPDPEQMKALATVMKHMTDVNGRISFSCADKAAEQNVCLGLMRAGIRPAFDSPVQPDAITQAVYETTREGAERLRPNVRNNPSAPQGPRPQPQNQGTSG